jgi:hypothetical protein
LKFIEVVKSEIPSNGEYFNFYDIPDLIILKKYSKEYVAKIIEFLNKVKTLYLEDKLDKINSKKGLRVQDYNSDDEDDPQVNDNEQTVADMQVTDDDFIPFELLYRGLSLIE